MTSAGTTYGVPLDIQTGRASTALRGTYGDLFDTDLDAVAASLHAAYAPKYVLK